MMVPRSDHILGNCKIIWEVLISNISIHFYMFGLTTNNPEYLKFSLILRDLIFTFFLGFQSGDGLATIVGYINVKIHQQKITM